MASLRREMVADYNLSDAVTIEQLQQLTTDEAEQKLLPVESLFETLPKVCLPEFFERLCRSGCEIYQKKIHTSLPLGARVRLCNESEHFFAWGQVDDYPDGSAIRSIKLFELYKTTASRRWFFINYTPSRSLLMISASVAVVVET